MLIHLALLSGALYLEAYFTKENSKLNQVLLKTFLKDILLTNLFSKMNVVQELII